MLAKTSAVVLALGLAGCSESAEPRPQWLVVVSTDARVPQMGDRVLVEVLGPTGGALACSGCRRLFGANGPVDLPIELGVAPSPSGTQLRVRARLLRSSALDGYDGGAAAAIDRTGMLSEPAADARVSLRLAMDCFGVAADPESALSCDPATAALAAEIALPRVDEEPPLVPDSWAPAADAPCAGAPDDDSVCIPGGTFLLGALDGVGSFDSSPAPLPERLVRVSPFFLERDEYTIGRWKQLSDEGLAPTSQPGIGPNCTFTSIGDPEAQGLPLTCVSRELAEQICKAEGKRLPTEAEWEFAASNRTLETRYPWGDDDDVCAHAVVARGSSIKTCLVSATGTLLPGLVPSGQADDVTLLGVRDLGGNVSEWVDGTGAAYDSGCFDPEAKLLVDPRCDDPAFLPVARGGHWEGTRSGARAASRAVRGSGNGSTGFRCARSDVAPP